MFMVTCQDICGDCWPCTTSEISRGLSNERRLWTERLSSWSSCRRRPGNDGGSRVKRCSHDGSPSAPARHTSPPTDALSTSTFTVLLSCVQSLCSSCFYAVTRLQAKPHVSIGLCRPSVCLCVTACGSRRMGLP